MVSGMADATIPPADALASGSLLAYAEQGIASRVLAKTDGGNVTEPEAGRCALVPSPDGSVAAPGSPMRGGD
jgi:hypothetical protein